MNELLQTYISKRVTESLAAQDGQLIDAIYTGVPENAPIEEALPIILCNILQISIKSSVCTTLDLLDSASVVNLQTDEVLLRSRLLTLLKD